MELQDYYFKNKPKWTEELITQWKHDRWTDCCLDEYCAYKMWVYTQGEDYFKGLQEYMKSSGEDLQLEDLRHDAWKLYLQDLGFDSKPFGLELLTRIQEQDKKHKKFNIEGGLA